MNELRRHLQWYHEETTQNNVGSHSAGSLTLQQRVRELSKVISEINDRRHTMNEELARLRLQHRDKLKEEAGMTTAIHEAMKQYREYDMNEKEMDLKQVQVEQRALDEQIMIKEAQMKALQDEMDGRRANDMQTVQVSFHVPKHVVYYTSVKMMCVLYARVMKQFEKK